MKQTIVWTALPNGISGRSLKLSVFVAPRLEPDVSPALLESFEVWLDWPRALAAIDLRLAFQKGTEAVRLEARVDPESQRPDSDLWRSLFSGSTAVEGFEVKGFDKRLIHSYPVRNVASFLGERYRRYAVDSPTEHPSTEMLLDPTRGFGRIAAPEGLEADEAGSKAGTGPTAFRSAKAGQLRVESLHRATRERVKPLFKGKMFVAPAPPDAEQDFLQARLFHLSRQARQVEARPEPPKIEFHRIVAAMGQHPRFLRRLGLVVDLLVELPEPPQALPPEGRVWVTPVGVPPGIANRTPQTEYSLRPAEHPANAFTARSQNGGDHRGRFLALGDGRFEVVQSDLDGATQKTMRMADRLQREVSPQVASLDTPRRAALPSLRSAGLSVARTGRAEQLHQTFARAVAVNKKLVQSEDAGDSGLWAEDLTRGYRVDVLDGTSGAWRSLCRRVTTYERPDGTVLDRVEDGEGWISSSVAQTADTNAPDADDIYVQESLFRWAGWSLVTPRPGKHMGKDQRPTAITHDPVREIPLKISTAPAPRTLPKLRFGTRYRIRARAVDLAGNSLSLEEADALMSPQMLEAVATAPVNYRRSDVVTQPVVVFHREPDPRQRGEELERMVIRSYNRGEVQPGEKVAPGELSTEGSQRHVAPSRAAQLTAETHGMFDGVAGLDPAAYARIVALDGDYGQPARPGSSPGATAYPVSQLHLPYLPDPVGRGAAFVGLPRRASANNTVAVYLSDGTRRDRSLGEMPGEPVAVTQVEFGTLEEWPEWRPFRLRTVASQEPRDPEWNAAGRELTVFLPPAEVARVRLSSFPGEEDLHKMMIWRWIDGEGKEAELRGRVLAGMHWMLTPCRELTLVHAVQRPLVKPEFQHLVSHREVNATWADLADSIPVSGKSTAKLDLEAAWTEPLDTGDAPTRIDGRDHAFELLLDASDRAADFGPDRILVRAPIRRRAEVGERRLGASGVSRETATRQRAVQVTKLQRAPELAAHEFPGSRHEFGDTKHRRVTYTAVATSRFRSYFPFSDDEIREAETRVGDRRVTRRSEPVTIDILSSARPAAPDVAYVLPTFGWEEEETSSGLTRRRLGGGLRVYLRRPWFSSGEGELLGVVLAQGSRAGLGIRSVVPVPDGLRPLVTQWGMDPLWLTEPTSQPLAPAVTDFKNAVANEGNLTLEELPGARVSVVGFSVGGWDEGGDLFGYEPERGLWYCDIELDPGQSYFPFVRLALARCQPRSLSWDGGDVKLSRVVLADFAQLAPDRAASVAFLSDTRLRVTVSGLTARKSSEQQFGHAGSVADRPGRSAIATAPGTAVTPSRAEQSQDLSRRQVAAGPQRRVLGPTDTGGNTVEVSLETLPPGEDDSLGWLAVPDSTIELEPGARRGATASWSGELVLPEPRGTRRFRLVIKEHEWLIQDGVPVRVGEEMRLPAAPRIVYADVMEI